MKNRDLILQLLGFSFDAEVCFTDSKSVTVDEVDFGFFGDDPRISKVVCLSAADKIDEEGNI